VPAGVAGCGKVFYKSIKIVDYLFGDWRIAYYLYSIKSAVIADIPDALVCGVICRDGRWLSIPVISAVARASGN
jgi:hypothetical protein